MEDSLVHRAVISQVPKKPVTILRADLFLLLALLRYPTRRRTRWFIGWGCPRAHRHLETIRKKDKANLFLLFLKPAPPPRLIIIPARSQLLMLKGERTRKTEEEYGITNLAFAPPLFEIYFHQIGKQEEIIDKRRRHGNYIVKSESQKSQNMKEAFTGPMSPNVIDFFVSTLRQVGQNAIVRPRTQ